MVYSIFHIYFGTHRLLRSQMYRCFLVVEDVGIFEADLDTSWGFRYLSECIHFIIRPDPVVHYGSVFGGSILYVALAPNN